MIVDDCFLEQEDIVKLQILNLGAKLLITNPKQVGDVLELQFSLRTQKKCVRRTLYVTQNPRCIFTQHNDERMYCQLVFLITESVAVSPLLRYRIMYLSVITPIKPVFIWGCEDCFGGILKIV